jgi:hypothetical protein
LKISSKFVALGRSQFHGASEPPRAQAHPRDTHRRIDCGQ